MFYILYNSTATTTTSRHRHSSTSSATPTTLSFVTHHVTFTALLFHCHHCTNPILYLNRRKQPLWFHVLSSLLPHPFSCTTTIITNCYLYQSPRHYHRLQWLYDSRRFLSEERNCKLHVLNKGISKVCPFISWRKIITHPSTPRERRNSLDSSLVTTEFSLCILEGKSHATTSTSTP